MSVIRIEDIAHVRYAAPDLQAMREFLDDFGMETFEVAGRLYGKGSDGRPFIHVTESGEARFLALGLRAEAWPIWKPWPRMRVFRSNRWSNLAAEAWFA